MAYVEGEMPITVGGGYPYPYPPYYGGGNGGLFGNGSDGIWAILLFAMIFGRGWGNFGGGNGGGGTPIVLGGGYYGGDVQRGFDQQAIMSGINGLTTTVSNGFANAEVSRCNAQTNLLQAMNTNQAATVAGMNNIAMGLQNCCCENRAGLADLKYTVATENCADRAAVSDGIRDVITNATANTQAILDKLCSLEIDNLKERNAQLLAENSNLKFDRSQVAQTAQIIANNNAQTAALEQYLNPAPIPAYVVQNPNCCVRNYGGCGCGYGQSIQ